MDKLFGSHREASSAPFNSTRAIGPTTSGRTFATQSLPQAKSFQTAIDESTTANTLAEQRVF